MKQFDTKDALQDIGAKQVTGIMSTVTVGALAQAGKPTDT